jgi:hypothetical protein
LIDLYDRIVTGTCVKIRLAQISVHQQSVEQFGSFMLHEGGGGLFLTMQVK